MRRGNFFRRNQYKIAAVCLLAAVLGLAGAYMLLGRGAKEDEQQQAAVKEPRQEARQESVQAKKEEKEEKEQEKKEEKDTEQTTRVSAIVKPKQYEVAAKDKDEPKEQQGAAAEEEAGKGQQDEPQKTVETGTSSAAPAAELHFNAENGLLWPVNGAVILDYSMDQTVYFTTLDQYKYNPAVIISGNVNDKVKAAASGKITDISVNEVTGCTVTMDLGDGYTAIYGQLKEVPYNAGAYLEAGNTLGFVSEPTKYYSLEGSNLYFALEKDGKPVDPVEFFTSSSSD